MGKANPRLDAWRRSFHYDADLHPERRELSSLEDILERVGAALGYVQALDSPTPAEKDVAVAVAGMAVEYVERVYAHLHWSDGPPLPKPTNLGVAKMVLENLLADAQQKRALRWLAGRGEDDDALEETGQAGATGDAKKDDRPPRRPLPDDEAEVEVRTFLEKHPHANARQVAEGVGIALGRVSGLAAWRSALGKRKANKRPGTKKPRPLTQKMVQAIGREDDPAARMEAEEAAWLHLIDQAKPPERAKLHAMPKEERARLIQAYLESRTQEVEDFGPSRS
jgi:hypothetical protein